MGGGGGGSGEAGWIDVAVICVGCSWGVYVEVPSVPFVLVHVVSHVVIRIVSVMVHCVQRLPAAVMVSCTPPVYV